MRQYSKTHQSAILRNPTLIFPKTTYFPTLLNSIFSSFSLPYHHVATAPCKERHHLLSTDSLPLSPIQPLQLFPISHKPSAGHDSAVRHIITSSFRHMLFCDHWTRRGSIRSFGCRGKALFRALSLGRDQRCVSRRPPPHYAGESSRQMCEGGISEAERRRLEGRYSVKGLREGNN